MRLTGGDEVKPGGIAAGFVSSRRFAIKQTAIEYRVWTAVKFRYETSGAIKCRLRTAVKFCPKDAVAKVGTMLKKAENR